MTVGELFIKFGIISEDEGIKKFSDGITDVSKKLSFAIGSFIAASYALNKYVSAVTKASVTEKNFNQQTGLSIDLLRKWQVAGTLADTSMTFDEVAESVQNLQKMLTEIRLGGGDVKAFQMLGIDIAGKNAFDILEQVRESIKGLDNATATNLIQRIGLSPRFINILRLSNEEFKRLSEQRFLTEEQNKALVDLSVSFTKLRIEMSIFFRSLGSMFAPALKDIGELAGQVTHLVGTFRNWITESQILGPILKKIGREFKLIKDLISGIIMVIDDLLSFFSGEDSLLGRIIDPIDEKINNFLSGILDKIKAIKNEFNIGGMLTGGPEWEGVKRFFNFNAPAGNTGDKTANINNIFNISSMGQGQEVADQIGSIQKRQLNYALADIDNGMVI